MMVKNKIFILLILISILSLILFPFSTVKAQLGTGIFDYFEAAEGGIEEHTKPLLQRILFILFTALIGVFLLFLSSFLLELMISHPEWLSLKNPIVQSGLYFTTGLVNLFIILFFVAIAITWILKIETFAAKKALPKLILVALLVNFMPVFVGIPLDIATIIHKTILTDTNLVSQSIEALFGGMDKLITGLVSWMIALAALFIIPFVSPFAEYGFVIIVLTIPLFGPILLSWIIQIILAILLSGIYFTLAFLFAARIYVIWFLTIAAPLAFLCLVLPQTEKYWKEWLRDLLDWTFFGLIVLLFLVVGLKGIKYIAPKSSVIAPATPGLGWLSLPEYFSYYFFLFVFISIISYFSKKFSPQMANTLIAQGAAVTGMFMGGMAVLGKGVTSSLQKSLAQQRETEERAREKQKRGEKLTRGERLALSRPVSGLRRFGGWTYRQATGISPEQAEALRIQQEAAEFERRFGDNTEAAIASQRVGGKLSGPSGTRAALALYLARKEGEKGLKRLKDDEFEGVTTALYSFGTKAQRKEFRKFARSRIEENPGLERFVNARDVDNEDIARLVRERVRIETEPGKFVEAEELWKGSAADREKVIREAARRNAIESLKAEDYEKILPETAEKMKESIVRYGRERRGIGRMIEKGVLDWGKIQDEIKRLGVREVAKTNAPLVMFPYSPMGRMVGAERPVDERGEIISEKRMREIIAEKQSNMYDWEKARRVVGEQPIGIPPSPPPTPRPPGRPSTPPAPPPGRPGPGPAPRRPPGRP